MWEEDLACRMQCVLQLMVCCSLQLMTYHCPCLLCRSIATRAAGNTVGQQETQQQQQQDQQEHQENELEKEKENEQENEKENEQENIQQQQDALFSYTATLQYDGTHYWGWQLQPPPAGRRAKPTIQLALEKALVRLTGEPREELKVQAAGRTDAGVHARGQVAQWYCRRQREPAALLRGLNALLPADIRAVGVQRVPLDFNVRYALQKTYRWVGVGGRVLGGLGRLQGALWAAVPHAACTHCPAAEGQPFCCVLFVPCPPLASLPLPTHPLAAATTSTWDPWPTPSSTASATTLAAPTAFASRPLPMCCRCWWGPTISPTLQTSVLRAPARALSRRFCATSCCLLRVAPGVLWI